MRHLGITANDQNRNVGCRSAELETSSLWQFLNGDGLDCMRRVGVYGGAFNPIHCGHRDVVKQAISVLDRIIIIPSAHHPFAKELLPFHHRVNMAKLSVAEFLADINVDVSEIEQTFETTKPVYTFDLLTALERDQALSPTNAQLSFIIGPDNVKQWQKFYRANEIERRWSVLAVDERKPIRATAIRQQLGEYWRLQQRRNEGNNLALIKALRQALAQNLGERVLQYILDHQLLRPPRLA